MYSFLIENNLSNIIFYNMIMHLKLHNNLGQDLYFKFYFIQNLLIISCYEEIDEIHLNRWNDYWNDYLAKWFNSNTYKETNLFKIK